MRKEIKIGKYVLTFGIEKSTQKKNKVTIGLPVIAAEVLRKEDEYLNSTHHHTFRDKIGRTISRVDRTPIKTKIVNEIEFTEEDVMKKMESISMDTGYKKEEKKELTKEEKDDILRYLETKVYTL